MTRRVIDVVNGTHNHNQTLLSIDDIDDDDVFGADPMS